MGGWPISWQSLGEGGFLLPHCEEGSSLTPEGPRRVRVGLEKGEEVAQSCKGGRCQCTLRAESPTIAPKTAAGPDVPGLESLGKGWVSVVSAGAVTPAAGP